MARYLPSALCRLRDVPRDGLILLVKAYRLLLKPSLGNACRFEPTCSQYALNALNRHGALVGASLSAARLLRCHPWCAGGCDPVPDNAPRLFTRLGLGSAGPEHPACGQPAADIVETPAAASAATRPVLREPYP
jgi:uncharacterized protein